jgi:hypothetical protein
VRLHYLKKPRQGLIDRLANHYHDYLGPAAYNKRIVIVGGGFGWVAEGLIGLGFLNVVVAETSPYVLSEMDNTDEAEIRGNITDAGLDPDTGRGAEVLANATTPAARRGTTAVVNADVMTDAGRDAIKSALGGNPQIVVTEDVTTSLTDQECLDLSVACHAFPGQETVIHAVSTLQPDGSQNPVFNWKTLAAWKALIPGDTWIDVRTGEVL